MSRDLILDKLRRNAAGGQSRAEREKAVAKRIRSASRGVLPAQPRAATARVTQFMEKAEAAQATTVMTTRTGVAEAIADWLRAHNLPAEIRTGKDERLKALLGGKAGNLILRQGPSDGTDTTGVSHAECGVCETGTLIVLSGADNPTTLNFLPQNHIVVLRRSDILAHYEDIWPRLRTAYGKGQMPRTVNMITGPSRSADIEQTLLLGAHGPVRLHIVIVRD
ncbi:MAG: LUD domain-containing protein [Nitratireductor sp.]|nr:LUD domain-containing protein [Nitratireductor sp.]